MKDRDYYLQQIISNIKAVEEINIKHHKPRNYRLKGLGKHLVNKTYVTHDNKRLDSIENELHKLNATINPDTINSDKHPVTYLLDDIGSGLIFIMFIALVIWLIDQLF